MPFVPVFAAAAPAYAKYSHASNHASGFGQLRVQTNPQYSNKLQMQGAGFVEGYLTAPEIFDHWYNQHWWLNSKTNDTFKVFDWWVVACCSLRVPHVHTVDSSSATRASA